MGVTASVVGIASGINSLTGGGVTSALGLGGGTTSVSGTNTSTAAGAQAAADPFAQYRSNLGALYAGALTTGSGVDPTKLPGYTAYKTGVLDPSLEASKRSAAQSGQLYSGNEAIALQKTGQQGYYGFMTDYLNRLAQGSGATQSPATAAALGVQQGNISSAGQMQGLGAIAQGLASFGSSANTGAGTYYGAGGGITASAMNAPIVDAYGNAATMGYANF